jgi:hypothetical protein
MPRHRETIHMGDVHASPPAPPPLAVIVHEGAPERIELAERPAEHSPLTVEDVAAAMRQVDDRAGASGDLILPASAFPTPAPPTEAEELRQRVAAWADIQPATSGAFDVSDSNPEE